jgi:carboxypeptidase family protein/TonB-dependent receptor-like protein
MSRNPNYRAVGSHGFDDRRWWFTLLLVAATSLSNVASAQKVKIRGTVRDSVDTPIADADVSIPAAHLLTRSNETGAFSLDRVPAGHVELSIRRLGYAPATFLLEVSSAVDTLTVHMVAQALELPGMVVSEQMKRHLLWIEDFYRRRAKGIGGTYYTRDDIEARHASRLSDVVRDAPGVRFVRARDGSGIRFDSPANFRSNCLPQYFVDGQRVTNLELDDFPPRDIEGIELYNGPSSTPMQFSQGAVTSCGTVVIWSRVPGT